MKKDFEIRDEQLGYVVMGMYYDSDIKDYPFRFYVPDDDGDKEVIKYLKTEEVLKLFYEMRDIFEPCLKNI